jgi:rhodanese-related sulfurtransferase
VRSVSAADVHVRRQRGEDFLLLDVRDRDEHERARVEGSTLIPVGELVDRLDEIAEHRSGPVVVHCHHGPRSRRACELLIENGFTRVEEMAGGIEAWSVTVDPDVPRY